MLWVYYSIDDYNNVSWYNCWHPKCYIAICAYPEPFSNIQPKSKLQVSLEFVRFYISY